MTRTTAYRLFILVLFVTFFSLPGLTFAQRGEIYTIQKGDTLWDLSQRFIDDPLYWPNIWSDNPELITNPHLIFPGQQIRILDGRLQIIPAFADAPAKKPADEVAPQTQEELSVLVSGRGDGFILVDEHPQGQILDATDNRILLTETDLVFAATNSGTIARVGDTFGLYQRGETVVHPHDKQQSLGTMMHNLGALTVVEVRGSTVVGRIDRAYREITRGAELFYYDPPRRDIALRRGTTETPGTLVASLAEKGTISTGDIVFIDLGRAHELAVGNLFYISRPRQLTDEALRGANNLDLPQEVIGAGIVTETRETTSTALIIKSVDTAAIGNRVTVASD